MKWRIVTDQLFGFRAQHKYPWWPFWFNYVGDASILGSTVEEVEEKVREHEKLMKWRRKVVKELS